MTKYLIICAVIVVVITGCATPLDSSGADGGNQSSSDAKVIVVLVNGTSVPVDPHLYISSSKLSADALFADEGNIESNFNGKTTIAAGDVISLPFSYEDVVTIGSSAAKFGSAADWQAGESADSPVLYQQDDFSANKVIIFRFTKDQQGIYHTTCTVADTVPTQ